MTRLTACAVLATALFGEMAGASASDGREAPQSLARSLQEQMSLAAADFGSITFVKNGNVFILDPDASEPQQVTTGGGYAWPTQDDGGTIVAVRQTEVTSGGVTRHPRFLHRMNRKGALLNPPVETVDPENSLYTGPLMPEVSPDGRYVAYHYFYSGGGSGSPTICYSHSDQDTVNGELGCLGGYLSPSWLDNTFVMAFEATSGFTDGVWLDQVGEVDSSFWFNDESVTSIAHGEVSPDLSRFAATGYAGDQEMLLLYDMTGGPPAVPVQKCVFTGATGYFDEPTWSPDGSFLLWEEGDGIWAAEVTSLDDCPSITAGLLLPGAEDPHWSPAAFSSSLEVSMKIGGQQSLSALLSGLKPKVTCSAGCKITGKLIADAATSRKYNLGSSSTVVGSGSGNLGSAGTRAITVELTAEAKRKLKRAGRAFELTLKVTGSGGGTKDVAKKTIRIARESSATDSRKQVSRRMRRNE